MDLMICGTCGVQYNSRAASSCKLCDDPRQYIPPEGQWWTTLRSLQQSGKYGNEFIMSKNHSGVISIVTEPKVGLGQRAILCCTRQGNLLWDCITYIDDDTVRRINELGGIDAIAISHPHYYSTAVEWAHTFNCPVYYSAEDEEWIMRFDIRSRVHMVPNDVLDSVHKGACQVLWTGPEMNLLHGELKVVKTSGHFPGSSVLYWRDARKLLVADSVFVVPSGRYTVDRLPGTVSFTFMWSYPNMIPLPPDDVHKIWKALKGLEFDDAHGGFMGNDAHGNSRKRLLESAQLYVKHAGYAEHAILEEKP